MNNILSIDSEDRSEEIFSQLKNKKFFAISIEKNGKTTLSQNKISKEEIIFSCNLLIHDIMSRVFV
jgi:hypothetical protein